jgi:hypothetical protein
MIVTYENFVGVYDDLLPAGYCQHLISEFDRLELDNVGANRQKGEGAKKHVKDDYQININGRSIWMAPFQERSPQDMFFDGLQTCYNLYTDKYSVLKEGKIRGDTMKMQRTAPGGGYHVWHGEQSNGHHANRVLVYMLYLNTLPLESAGETEFLYQQKRYSPIENRMLVWPASYTHAHRGNTVFGEQSKYIVTGWFYYD